jgi:hypothetical protein
MLRETAAYQQQRREPAGHGPDEAKTRLMVLELAQMTLNTGCRVHYNIFLSLVARIIVHGRVTVNARQLSVNDIAYP